MSMLRAKVVCGTQARVEVVFQPPGYEQHENPLRPVSINQSYSQQFDEEFTGGTNNPIDLLVVHDRKLMGNTSFTFDLYNGTDLKDMYNRNAPFRKVRLLAVFLTKGGNSNGLRIGGAGSDAWVGYFGSATDRHLIYPGGCPYTAARPEGVTVTPTSRNVMIENLGSNEAYVRIIVAGSSA